MPICMGSVISDWNHVCLARTGVSTERWESDTVWPACDNESRLRAASLSGLFKSNHQHRLSDKPQVEI